MKEDQGGHFVASIEGRSPAGPSADRPDSLRAVASQVFFNTAKQITACEIQPYMLEKSRVTSQQMNERGAQSDACDCCPLDARSHRAPLPVVGFHIFYQMETGPDPTTLGGKKQAKYEAAITHNGVQYTYDKAKYPPWASIGISFILLSLNCNPRPVPHS